MAHLRLQISSEAVLLRLFQTKTLFLFQPTSFPRENCSPFQRSSHIGFCFQIKFLLYFTKMFQIQLEILFAVVFCCWLRFQKLIYFGESSEISQNLTDSSRKQLKENSFFSFAKTTFLTKISKIFFYFCKKSDPNDFLVKISELQL